MDSMARTDDPVKHEAADDLAAADAMARAAWEALRALDHADDGTTGAWYDPDLEDAGDGDWDDDATWELGPAPGLDLAGLADREAARYLACDTEAGDLFAAMFGRLAGRVRALEATTPGQYLDRLDAMHDAAL